MKRTRIRGVLVADWVHAEQGPDHFEIGGSIRNLNVTGTVTSIEGLEAGGVAVYVDESLWRSYPEHAINWVEWHEVDEAP